MIDEETVAATVELVRRTASVHIDKRASRRLKKVNAAGEVVGEIESADVLAGLLDAEKVRHDELKVKEAAEVRDAWDAVRERRKAGLPDLCGTCGAELSMKPGTLKVRNRVYRTRPPRFQCKRCWASGHIASVNQRDGAEVKRERIASARKSIDPASRGKSGGAATRKKLESMSASEREAVYRARSVAVRRAKQALAPERRRESAKRSWATRRAKVQP